MDERPPWQELSRRGRVRVMTFSMLRSVGTFVALLVAYLIFTVQDSAPVRPVAWLIGGLVLVVIVVWWQLRTIQKTAYPVIQATQSVILSFWLLIVLFAAVYVTMSQFNVGSFSEPLDQVGGIYFSITTLSTVGYGDIHPISSAARIVVSAQMILDLALIGVVVQLFIGTARSRTASSPK